MKQRVLVLLSSYNGEQFIKEQIFSILSQQDVEVSILIRDDGSRDSTLRTVEEIDDKRIKVYEGKNLGAAFSFYDLLRIAAEEYPHFNYYAFSDQDDIWLDDKIISAIRALEDNNCELYCGSVDAFRGNNLKEHTVFRSVKYSMVETMLRNSTPGCTMVFTKVLIDTILRYKPSFLEMHDSWIVRVSQYSGIRVFHDVNAHMRYRLHGDNACGAKVTAFDRIRQHVKNVLFRDGNTVSNTAHELLEGYNDRFDDCTVKYLKTLDRKQHTQFRRLKLIKYAIKSEMSSVSRKIDFIIMAVLGKI